MPSNLKSIGAVGLLSIKDLHELNSACRRIYSLMLDGKFHTSEEIDMAAGQYGKPAREGLRRMRELRDVFGPYCIEKKKVGNSRSFLYRLKIAAKVKQQLRMF